MNSTLSPRDTHSGHDAGKLLLLDVRTPAEYGELHIPGSTLMPLDRLDAAKVAEAAAGRPCVLVCRTGRRAEDARRKLETSGCAPLAVLEGGVTAWDAAGLPVTRGKAAISLERQVRIAAGALVLAGAILGSTVHPLFYGLSAFVGAGLVFAGLTDWCGMGLLLARMPWNQRSA